MIYASYLTSCNYCFGEPRFFRFLVQKPCLRGCILRAFTVFVKACRDRRVVAVQRLYAKILLFFPLNRTAYAVVLVFRRVFPI